MTLFFAAISGNTLLTAILWLVVGALIYFVLDWGIKRVGIPEPFNKIVQVLLVLFVVAVVINALLVLVGKPFIQF